MCLERTERLLGVKGDLAVAEGNLREVQNKVADLKKSFDDAQRKEKVLKDDS